MTGDHVTGASDLDAVLPPLPPSGRVALLGGSFNPPHLAHALLALSVLAVEDVEALWVLPCADHPFGKGLAPLEDRLEMCRRTFSYLGEAVRVVDVESRLPKPSYTVQTVRALLAARPGLEPRWIVGSDILDELHLWKEPEELGRLAPLLVFPRAGYRREGRLDFSLPEISSTDLRARIARGDDVAGSVDRRVAAYIEERGLYRE